MLIAFAILPRLCCNFGGEDDRKLRFMCFGVASHPKTVWNLYTILPYTNERAGDTQRKKTRPKKKGYRNEKIEAKVKVFAHNSAIRMLLWQDTFTKYAEQHHHLQCRWLTVWVFASIKMNVPITHFHVSMLSFTIITTTTITSTNFLSLCVKEYSVECASFPGRRVSFS